MSLPASIYRFDGFALDTTQRVLYQNGKPMRLTPKAAHLLSILVSRHGQLVEKDVLFREIWPDSFVEDSNLTFNVAQLRKALRDTKKPARYIETVPRRGYRFVADVSSDLPGPGDANAYGAPEAARAPMLGKHVTESSRIVVPLATLVVVAVILTGSWLYSSVSSSTAAVLTSPFAAERISTNGKVPLAVVSPDGRFAVYIVETEDRSSVWLGQFETGNNVELIPQFDGRYGGLAVSPGSDSLYFVRSALGDERMDIFRTPIFGGIPVKVVSDTQGWFSLAPDGSKISFVRCNRKDDDFCSLWVADAADGANEKRLVLRPRPIRIGPNQISPDGATIAFAYGQSENQANEFELGEIEIETGGERRITDERFFNIKSLAWLPGGSGLLTTASRIPNTNFRIWHLSRSAGAMALTTDSETYATISIDRPAETIVAIRSSPDLKLEIKELDVPTDGRFIADATTVSFDPNGRLFFSSTMTGNNEIWSISIDGSGRKQLTNHQSDETAPIASRDGHSVFFASNRSGEVHVWRMDADGGNQAQLTTKNGGFPIITSSDERWLYYQHGLKRTLWRTDIEKATEEEVLPTAAYRFAISPDGTKGAYVEEVGDGYVVRIVSIPGGKLLRTFVPEGKRSPIREIAWRPDQAGFLYSQASAKSTHDMLWFQPFSGGPARQLAKRGSDFISQIAVSPDGKSLAIVSGGWDHDAVLIRGLK